MEKDKRLIPKGPYCYNMEGDKIINCPYWSLRKNRREQENGHCAFLEKGDWQLGKYSMLWDQIKECGVDDDWAEEDLYGFLGGNE